MSDRASRGFASDNAATIHPAVIAAIERANVGHAFGYGHDDYSRHVTLAEMRGTKYLPACYVPFPELERLRR